MIWENIQHKLTSDYSLNIYFSRCFPYIDGPSFSPYKPLQNVDFSKVGSMQFFFQELYSDIDKNSVKKFEDMFLVKIASKGTPLIGSKLDRMNRPKCDANILSADHVVHSRTFVHKLVSSNILVNIV